VTGEGNVPAAAGVTGRSVSSGGNGVMAGTARVATDVGAIPLGTSAGDVGASVAVVTVVSTFVSDAMGVARVALGPEQAPPKITKAIQAMTIPKPRNPEEAMYIIRPIPF